MRWCVRERYVGCGVRCGVRVVQRCRERQRIVCGGFVRLYLQQRLSHVQWRLQFQPRREHVWCLVCRLYPAGEFDTHL